MDEELRNGQIEKYARFFLDFFLAFVSMRKFLDGFFSRFAGCQDQIEFARDLNDFEEKINQDCALQLLLLPFLCQTSSEKGQKIWEEMVKASKTKTILLAQTKDSRLLPNLIAQIFDLNVNNDYQRQFPEISSGEFLLFLCETMFSHVEMNYGDSGVNMNYSIPLKALTPVFTYLDSFSYSLEENLEKSGESVISPAVLGLAYQFLLKPKEQEIKGIVYTQLEEISLMCTYSFYERLAERFPEMREVLRQVVFNNERPSILSVETAKDIIAAIEGCNIVDPACGAGAFLRGMLQKAEEILEVLYGHETKTEEMISRPTKPSRSVIDSLNTLVSSRCYGVDVEEWAVYLTRFRLQFYYFSFTGNSLTRRWPLLIQNIVHGDAIWQPRQISIGCIHRMKPGRISSLDGSILLERLEQYKEQGTQIQFVTETFKRDYVESYAEQQLACYEAIGQWVLKSKDKKLKGETKQHFAEVVSNLKTFKKTPYFTWSLTFLEVFLQGGFDILIGNPPYIRQEKIVPFMKEIKSKGLKYKKELHSYIQRVWKTEYPSLPDLEIAINKQSDYLVYFYLMTLPLVKPGCIHCFITSNSWLDVKYGLELQEIISKFFELGFLFDNQSQSSFMDADINTIITLLRRPKATLLANFAKNIKFIVAKESFRPLLQSSVLKKIEQTAEAFQETEYYVRYLPQAALLQIGSGLTTEKIEKLVGKTGEANKIKPLIELEYNVNKWGNFLLRMPPLLDLALYQCLQLPNILRFADVFEVKGGIKSGANRFFLLQKTADQPPKNNFIKVTNGYGHEFILEPEFVRPILHSPKDIKYPYFKDNEGEQYVFWCGHSKAELQREKKEATNDYIRWAEKYRVEITRGKRKGTTIQGINQLKTLQAKNPWYSLAYYEPGTIALQKIYNDTFKLVISEDPLPCLDNFHALKIRPEYEEYRWLLYGFLLSSFLVFNLQLFGRVNFGGGALDIKVFEIEQLFIPDPKTFSREECHEIKEFTQKLIQRPFLPLKQRIFDPLQKQLDSVFLKKIGISGKLVRDFHKGLIEFVYTRLLKANKCEPEILSLLD